MTVLDPDKTPVASDIFTYCTREKRDTWHVVVCHNVQGRVERVQCKACGSNHLYKSKKNDSKSAADKQRFMVVRRGGNGQTHQVASAQNRKLSDSKSSATSSALDEIWFEGLKAWGDKDIRTYDPQLCFVEGEVLRHPVFGKGLVQKRRDNKIDVLFQQGIKTFPSARSSS